MIPNRTDPIWNYISTIDLVNTKINLLQMNHTCILADAKVVNKVVFLHYSEVPINNHANIHSRLFTFLFLDYLFLNTVTDSIQI